MAATGLLGFNPYGKGVAIDFSSKPTQLAIQLGQKEQAKKEALDKYYMDYEKTLNPAGMRGQDQDVFLGKLGEAKQYYLKNRDCILNPAKCGAEAQSTYLSYLKEAQGIIGESKAQGADDKVVGEHIYQAIQQGKSLHDGLIPIIEASHHNIRDPRFKKVDPYALQFDKPHDEAVFTKNVWGNAKLPTREIPEKLPNGQVQYRKESYLTPELSQTAVVNAINEYKSNPGTTKHFNELMKDESILSAAQNIFGETFKYIDPATKKQVKPKIETPEQFVAGYALLKKPTGDVSIGKADYPWLYKFNRTQGAIDARADKNAEEMGDPVDTFLNDARSGKTFAGREGENIEVMNLPETILKDLGKNKRPAVIGRGLGDNEFYNIVYQLDKKGNKLDLIDWTKTEKIPGSQIRSSVVARALPSGAKVKLVEGGRGVLKSDAKAPTKETLADKMRRLKNK